MADKYQIDNENIKQLKVKLLVVNNKKIDFSYMFYECKPLKNFILLSKEEEILEKLYRIENTNEFSESIHENYSNDLDNQLTSTFKNTYDDSDLNTIINQAINIYYKNNYPNENNDGKDMYNII